MTETPTPQRVDAAIRDFDSTCHRVRALTVSMQLDAKIPMSGIIDRAIGFLRGTMMAVADLSERIAGVNLAEKTIGAFCRLKPHHFRAMIEPEVLRGKGDLSPSEITRRTARAVADAWA